MAEPTVTDIRLCPGIAGQYAYTVTVKYDPQPANVVAFVSNVYSDAIYLVLDGFGMIRVMEPQRFGFELNPTWIQNFYAKATWEEQAA